MAEKKKSIVPQHSMRKEDAVLRDAQKAMSNRQQANPDSTGDTPRVGVPSRSGAVAVKQPMTPQSQLGSFESAMRLFHARRFKDARDAFEAARQGPERDIANRAGLHIQMCNRRLQEEALPLESAEDHYNYAIALINTRNLAAAREHLAKALELQPQSDHIHYAMALVKALSGDLNGAGQALSRAIDLEPRNRIAARQDTDFAPFVNQPPLDALLYPEKKSW